MLNDTMAEQQQHAATPLEEVKAKIAATEAEIAEKKQEIITAKKAKGIYVILFRFGVEIIECHHF